MLVSRFALGPGRDAAEIPVSPNSADLEWASLGGCWPPREEVRSAKYVDDVAAAAADDDDDCGPNREGDDDDVFSLLAVAPASGLSSLSPAIPGGAAARPPSAFSSSASFFSYCSCRLCCLAFARRFWNQF